MSMERILTIMATDLHIKQNGKTPRGKHSQIEKLLQTIEEEVDKPNDEADLDLVKECTEKFDELTHDIDHLCSQKSVEEFLKEMEAQGVDCSKLTPKEEGAGNKRKNGKKKSKKKSKKRPVAAVAAVAIITMLLFTIVSVAAHNQGYSNAWEFITENIKLILNLNTGESMEGDGITFIKGGENIAYKSIEELIENENCDILYPSILPTDIYLTRVYHNNINDIQFIWSFQFNDLNLTMSVSNTNQISQLDISKFEAHNTSSITFYIEALPDGTYQAIGFDNNYEYQIIYNDYNHLITLLDSMKGIQP